jgi:hypothetical protein
MDIGQTPKGPEPAAALPASTMPYWLLLACLLMFHMIANAWWLYQDNHVIRTDEEGHMQLARAYYQVLALDDHPNIIKKLIAVGDIKPGNPAHPPLLHFLGAIMIMIFGYSPDVIAATDTFLFLVMLVGCFLIARQFLDPGPALYTVFVVSMTPMIFSASRFFMTDYPAMAIVVWSIYALLRSNCFRYTGWVFVFAVLNGLGLLARPVTFLYYLLPCVFIVLAGFIQALRNRTNPDPAHGGVGRVLLHCVLTVVVTFGVSFFWYFHHLDTIYHVWTEVNKAPLAISAVDPGSASLEEVASEFVTPKAATPLRQPKLQTASMLTSPFPALSLNLRDRLMSPPIPWSRYPAYANNEGTFLALFILALIGIPLALIYKPYRSFTVLILLLWILGSWILMSTVFRHATERYTLPVLPALAIFASLTVMASPEKISRYLGMGALAILLLFQYGNLTVNAYGPIARVELPVDFASTGSDKFFESNLIVYKDQLNIGTGSYVQLSAPVKDNYKDRLLAAMAHSETAKTGIMGEFADYVRVGLRGMEFEEKHYWPEPNPFGDKTLEYKPSRKLRSIAYGEEPGKILPSLIEQADYVVYAANADQPEQEHAWQEFFSQRGFNVLEQFTYDGFGGVPTRNYALLARKQLGAMIVLSSKKDIDSLNRNQLLELMHSAVFSTLAPELQEYSHTRLEQLLSKFQRFQMTQEAAFVAGDIRRLSTDWFEFEILMHVTKVMDRDWKMYILGGVEESNKALLAEDLKGRDYMFWDFEPQPKTSTWLAGDYVKLLHRFRAQPIKYRLQLGFLDPDGELHGVPMDLSTWYDFDTFPIAGK